MDPIKAAIERAEFLSMLADVMYDDTESETLMALEAAEEAEANKTENKTETKPQTNTDANKPAEKTDNTDDKKKDDKGKLTIAQRLNNIYAYIEEAFKRMWTSMREMTTALSAEGKNYREALKNLTKGRKPDYNIRIRNYIYNDSVVENLPNITSTIFMEYNSAMEKIMNEWKNYDSQENYSEDAFKNKLEEFDKSSVGGLMLSNDVHKILANKFLGNTPNDLNGGGELYEALRKHFHGGKDDPEEYVLDSKRTELTKAVSIINSYENTCNTLNNGCNSLKQAVDATKNKASQFNSSQTNKNCADFVKRLQAYSKAMAALMGLYPFAASLVKERVINSYNLVKSAYKGVT